MDIITMQRSRLRHCWAVYQPDSIGEEAVFHSGGSRQDAEQPPVWGEGAKQSMCGVGGVSHDAGSSVSASADVDVWEGWKAASGDLLWRLYYPLLCLLLCLGAAAVPDCDVGGQYTLHHTSAEGAEDVAPFNFLRKNMRWWAFLTRLIVFSRQVRVLEHQGT